MNNKALTVLEYDRVKEHVLTYAQNEVSHVLILSLIHI